MTAIKTIVLETGITVEDAIHRIESVTLGYKNNASYIARVYVSLDKPAFMEVTGNINYSGGDIYAECYEGMISSGGYEMG